MEYSFHQYCYINCTVYRLSYFQELAEKRRLQKTGEPVVKPLGTIAEAEKEIREQLKTDVNDYFSYLENLKDKEDYEKFFKPLKNWILK